MCSQEINMKNYYVICALFALAYAGYYWYQQQAPVSPYTVYAHEIPGTYRIGFTNLTTECNQVPLIVMGKIPIWLSGRLLRNGPALFECNNSWVNWFDGLAMLHAFSIAQGRVWYTNKFLKTTNFAQVQKTGKLTYGGFLKDPCESLFQYVSTMFHPLRARFPEIPNANVNIVRYLDTYTAVTEIPAPIIFNPETLDTTGTLTYTDQLAQKYIHETPHPHYDPLRKEHISYFTQFGLTSSYNVYRIADGTRLRQIIAAVNVEEPSYMHSFSITQQYALLIALPLVVKPLNILLKHNAFIKNFDWKPHLGTQIIIFDRLKNKLVGYYKTEPFFAFHTVNAFEQPDQIILDIITYPTADSIYKADMGYLLASHRQIEAQKNRAGTLTRLTINIAQKTITSDILTDQALELPRINYEAHNGKKYTYVYAVGKQNLAPEPYYVADTLLKINVTNGTHKQWAERHCFPGEPVFIAKPNSTREDEGVIVSVVLDATKARSFLLILDAHNFKEIARAEVPHHIPFGIHGQYYQNN
jgi:beta,beta-carotene 9',10'-dioxygenase